MNEVRLQNAIWNDRGRQAKIVCPSYSPDGWTECDVWLVTKSGYAVEFEIKVSLADFKKDAQKTIAWREDVGPNWWDKEDRKATKHALLAQRDARGPSRFFYVIPEELEAVVRTILPTWAGLITAHYQRDYRNSSEGVPMKNMPLRLSEVVPAPKLHQTPIKQSVIEHCRGVFFYRYWNLRLREKNERWLTESLEKTDPLTFEPEESTAQTELPITEA